MNPGSGPRFDIGVAPGGYAWWYVDAMSEDRRHGLTIIAFVGSVFSPYYAWSGRRDPENHVALNVALYGASRGWAMTERGRGALARTSDRLAIGPSVLGWDGETLEIAIDEVTAPIPSRICGVVRVHAPEPMTIAYPLDPAGRHSWRPIATRAPVEVVLDRPGLSWRGEGYFDHNEGVEPLEDAFDDWQWLRAHRRHDTVVFYEGVRADGSTFALGLRIDAAGAAWPVDRPPQVPLPRTAWRMPRTARADAGTPVLIRKTWEDSPFYARTALSTRLFGEAADAVHESLSLGRLRSPLVRAMLPFRMPRVFF